MDRNYLRSRSNSKKGLWTLAKSGTSYSKYMKEDYAGERKYLSSLSDENKEWLNTFLLGYYHRNKKAMDELGFSTEARRSRYNQHRGVLGDIFHKRHRLDTKKSPTRKFYTKDRLEWVDKVIISFSNLKEGEDTERTLIEAISFQKGYHHHD